MLFRSTSVTKICEGSSVTFNNTSIDATGYSWNFPGGTTPDTTFQNPTVTYPVPGTYDVTLTAMGCGGDSTVSFTNYMLVYNIDTLISTLTICSNDSILLGGNYQNQSGTY